MVDVPSEETITNDTSIKDIIEQYTAEQNRTFIIYGQNITQYRTEKENTKHYTIRQYRRRGTK